MKSKTIFTTIFTLILLVACSVVLFFISKNSNDFIKLLVTAAISALLFSALAMFIPFLRDRANFHSQFNQSFFVMTIMLTLTRAFP
jgi:zinc transporter ZupT